MGGRVVEGARLESVFRLNRLTWVRIPPHPPLNKPRMGLIFMVERGRREPTLEWVRIRSVSVVDVRKDSPKLM